MFFAPAIVVAASRHSITGSASIEDVYVAIDKMEGIKIPASSRHSDSTREFVYLFVPAVMPLSRGARDNCKQS
jgi:hypothetical protein